MAKMGRPRSSNEEKRIKATWRADRHGTPRQPAPKGAKHTKAEEAAAWSELFSCGHDGFCDAQTLLGLDKYEVNRVAAEAWARLGEYWLKNVWPTLAQPPAIMPWALSRFGEPWDDPPK